MSIEKCKKQIGFWLVWCLASLPLVLAQGTPSVPGSSLDEAFAGRSGPRLVGTAVINVDTSETFPLIQDAINDPDTLNGHTLRVQVANHAEGQVLINKNITLEADPGLAAVTVSMQVNTGSAGDNRAWFLIETGNTATVRNLTFNGNGFLVFQAFRIKGGATFENCTFRDIQYNASGPDYAGFAIVAFANPVNVSGCSFTNIGRVGLFYFGAGVTGSQAINNVYIGKGVGDFLDYGFELGAGASATLVGNQISACRGEALVDGSQSGGMLLSTLFGGGTTGVITANTILDNTHGVLVGRTGDTSTATLSFNRIFSNDDGMQNESPSVVAENNWWGCNAGPGDPACDSVIGGMMADTDPWLVLALTAAPTTLLASQTSALSAVTTMNSDGVDTSGSGAIPNNTQIAFSADSGAVAPAMAGTIAGITASTYTAPMTPGMDNARATLDNQVVAAPITVGGAVDLVLTKMANPDPVFVGETLTYSLTLANNGPSTATAVMINDTLPASVTFLTVTPSPACTELNGTVTCNLPDLPAGQTTIVTIEVSPTMIGPLSNTAVADSAETDLVPGNETSTVSSSVLEPFEVPALGKGALIIFVFGILLVGLGLNRRWRKKLLVSD